MTLPDALSAPRRLLKAAMPVTPPPNIRSTATSASTRVILPLRRSPLPPLLLALAAGALLLFFFALESGGELRFYGTAHRHPGG